jgi:hypothetical protein
MSADTHNEAEIEARWSARPASPRCGDAFEDVAEQWARRAGGRLTAHLLVIEAGEHRDAARLSPRECVGAAPDGNQVVEPA